MRAIDRTPQQGFTTHLIAYILLGALAIMLILKVVPHYMDFFSIKGVVERQLAEKKSAVISEGELIVQVQRVFDINNIRGLRAREILSLEREGGVTAVYIDYEVEQEFVESDMADISLLMHFHGVVEKRVD